MTGFRNWLPIFRVRRDLDLSRAFRATLTSEGGSLTPHQATVLAHLRVFCFADQSTMAYDTDGRVDPHASAFNEGRRDVWRMVAFYLNLEERELIQLDRDYQQQLRDQQNRVVLDS